VNPPSGSRRIAAAMITFGRESDGGFVLRAVQDFPHRREDVFPFFAEARNLEAITPRSLGFQILTSDSELAMREGLLIDYRIRMRGVPMRWRTRIALWEPPFQFVDEQLRGPYALWHHTHRFEELAGSAGRPATRMADIVRYRPPLGRVIGGLANSVFVRRELRSIFEYRRRALRQRFGDCEMDHRESAAAMPLPSLCMTT
jgi:ligand-binding SRPBCC domain-containing protein